MSKSKKARLILFAPDLPNLIQARDQALEKLPGLRRIEAQSWLSLPEAERDARLKAELEQAKGSGFLILDPPSEVAELERIDRTAKAVFGRKGSPHAVFFAPPAPADTKSDDPYAGYRDDYRERFQHYRKDRRSVVFEKDAPKAMAKALKLATKAHSPLRWALLVPMLALLLGLGLVVFVFRDALLRRATIAVGQSAFGAKVEINLYETDLSPTLQVNDVAVADRDEPLRNLFELERFHSDLNFGALFGGRVHVRDAAIEGLRFGSPRETSGALPGLEVEVDGQPVDGRGPNLRGIATDRFDALIEVLRKKLTPPAPEDLETVRLARELETEAGQRLEALKTRLDGARFQERWQELESELTTWKAPLLPPALSALEGRLEELGAIDPNAALKAAEKALQEASAVNFAQELGSVQQAKARYETLRSSLKRAEDTIEEAAGLKKISFSNIAKLPGLIRDVKDAMSTLSGAAKEITDTRKILTDAKQVLDTKRTQGLASLGKARDLLQPRTQGNPSQDLWKQLQKDVEAAQQEAGQLTSQVGQKLAALQAGYQALETEWTEVQQEWTSSQTFLTEGLAGLEAAAERDYENLRARYDIRGWQVEELLAPLLGEELFGWYELAWSLRARLAPFLGSKESEGPTEIEMPDGSRRYVFPIDESEPAPQKARFWIELTTFSGELHLDDALLAMTGEATHLSSSPRLVGEPMKARFEASQGDRKVEGELRFDAQGVLSFEARGTNFDLEPSSSSRPYAPSLQQAAAWDWTLTGEAGPGGIQGKLDVTLRELNLTLLPEGVDPQLLDPFQRLYDKIDGVEATVEMRADASGIQDLLVQTDLGPEVQRAFEEALAQRVEEALAEARSEMDKTLAGPRNAANQAVQAFGVDAQALFGPLGADWQKLAQLFSGRSQEMIGFQDKLELPDLSAGPPEQEMDPKLKAELEKKLADQEQRLKNGGGADQEAESVLDGIALTEKARDEARERLEKELKRLEKLRP